MRYQKHCHKDQVFWININNSCISGAGLSFNELVNVTASSKTFLDLFKKFMDFLKKQNGKENKIPILLDNTTWHRAKIVRDYAENEELI